jgi:hypothetical protein
MSANWRPDCSPALVHRELEIIKTGLHCNTVRICARDTGRLATAAEDALRQGLEVWFCPELWNKPPGYDAAPHRAPPRPPRNCAPGGQDSWYSASAPN